MGWSRRRWQSPCHPATCHSWTSHQAVGRPRCLGASLGPQAILTFMLQEVQTALEGKKGRSVSCEEATKTATRGLRVPSTPARPAGPCLPLGSGHLGISLPSDSRISFPSLSSTSGPLLTMLAPSQGVPGLLAGACPLPSRECHLARGASVEGLSFEQQCTFFLFPTPAFKSKYLLVKI